MLSLTAFKPGTTSSDVTNYVENGIVGHQKREDYYTENGQAGGVLLGSGWQRYNLGRDDYTAQHIQRALDGQDIETGEKLIKGMTGSDGKSKRAPGYDLTFSADKSISIVFAGGDDNTKQMIIDAQNKATERVMRYIETNLFTVNVGKGGEERETAKLFASAHNHGTSRLGDPDIHTHVVLANFTERDDGKIMSLNARDIFARQKELGAIYRAEMAEQLKSSGFHIDKHGRDNELMKISGSPAEIEKYYSKRRAEIEGNEEAIQASMDKYGVSRARATEYVTLKTRHEKEGVTFEDIQAEWHKELQELGFDQSSIDEILAEALKEEREYALEDIQVLRKVTEFNSVFSEKKLRETFINEAVGILSVDEIESRVRFLLNSPDLKKVSKTFFDEETGKTKTKIAFTTQEMMDLERLMISQSRQLRSLNDHQISADLVEKHLAKFESDKGFSLTSDQKKALIEATTKSDLVVLEGHAGTGKTTAVEIAANSWRDAGFNVRGAAPSGKAADGLAGAGIESETIASLLLKNQGWEDENGKWHDAQNPLTKNDIIIVDESGMVGSRDMQKLTMASIEAGAKLVVMGDTKQLQSVAAGGAMAALINSFGVDASLNTVQRQRNESVKSVVALSREGNIHKSMDVLNEKGNLALVNDKVEGLDSVISTWQKHYQHNSKRAAETSVMLANTNTDVARLNTLARAHLKEIGVLKGVGADLDVVDRSGVSLGTKEFLENDRIVFLKNTKFGEGRVKDSVKNGQTGRIIGIDDKTLTVQIDGSDKVIKFNTDEYKSIAHAYAITTHKSQGITVDHAAILAGGFMQSLNQTYVQLSRVRHDVDLVLSKYEIEKEMGATEPTEKMLKTALNIAKEKGHDAEEIENMSFLECREYLNEFSKTFIAGKPEDEKEKWRREIGDLIDRMSQLDQKETTLEYEIIGKKDISREREYEYELTM